MRYKIDLAGFEGRKIEVEKKGLNNPRLFIDDIPVEMIGKREMILTNNDGENCVASWNNKTFSLDPIPRLKVGNEVIQVAEPLKWYAKILCLLPLVLFYFGAIGGACGVTAIYINHNICRLQISKFFKFILILLVSSLSLIAAVILVNIFIKLINL